MSQLSNLDKMVAIRCGKPITEGGLTYYPIKMAQYEQFQMYKNALLLRQTTLPAKYAVKNYLNAIFSYEMAFIEKGEPVIGLFGSLILLWGMALRIDIDLKSYLESNKIKTRVVNNELEITHLAMTQDGKTVEISATTFSTVVRQLIAEQNGLRLPNESVNSELVEAQDELAELENNSVTLDQNIESLIASVAYQSKCREQDINDWTVREFENRLKAIVRDKHFTLYKQAELSGFVTFKKGNPCPSWIYDTIDTAMGTMSLSTLGKQIGDVSQKE